MIPISLTGIREAAAHRPPGYAEDVLSRGTIQGDQILLEDGVYRELRQKYSPTIPATTKVRNAAQAAGRVASAILSGKEVAVSDEEKTRRLAICGACEFFDGEKCQKCGCYANLKARLATEHCPIGKW